MQLFYIKLNSSKELVFSQDLSFCQVYFIDQYMVMNSYGEGYPNYDYDAVDVTVDWKHVYGADIAKAVLNNEHKTLNNYHFAKLAHCCDTFAAFVNDMENWV